MTSWTYLTSISLMGADPFDLEVVGHVPLRGVGEWVALHASLEPFAREWAAASAPRSIGLWPTSLSFSKRIR